MILKDIAAAMRRCNFLEREFSHYPIIATLKFNF